MLKGDGVNRRQSRRSRVQTRIQSLENNVNSLGNQMRSDKKKGLKKKVKRKIASTKPAKEDTTYSQNDFMKPHVIILCGFLLVRLILRGKQQYVEAILSLSSFWYPFLSTLACVHELRYPETASSKVEPKVSRRWFQYWSIYALAQTLDQVLTLMITFGHKKQTILTAMLSEVKLSFFLFILIKPSVTNDLYTIAKPFVIEKFHQISEAVPEEKWERMFANKTCQILELMVSINILSSSLKDQAAFILRELRCLVVPAFISFLPLSPALFTRLGIVYTQYLLPVGKSTTELVSTKDPDLMHLHFLQYWILHSCFSVFLTFLGLFWWIPFYDHSMFLFWSYLSFDSTIRDYYNIFESDLLSLGILPGDPKVRVHQTQTVKAFKAIAKRMPTADEGALEEALQIFGEEEEKKAIGSEDQQRAVAQLKSLISQFPVSASGDDKTALLLKMLVNELQNQEDKDVQELERALAQDKGEDVVEEIVRVLTANDTDEADHTWLIDVTDYDENGEIDVRRQVKRGKEDLYYEARSMPSQRRVYKSSGELREAAEENYVSVKVPPAESVGTTRQSTEDKLMFPETVVEHVNGSIASSSTESSVRNRKNHKVKSSKLVHNNDNTKKTQRKKSEDFFYDANMAERKTSATTSFVTRLMTRMEQNQKHKRREKRERRKEKRLERTKNQDVQ